MRTGALIIVLLIGIQEPALNTEVAGFSVQAFSSMAGPYGVLWHLEIRPDGSARIFVGAPNRSNDERQFEVSSEHRRAILRAIEQSDFFKLPKYIGPEAIPLHEPENVLNIELKGRAMRVQLHDPAKAHGTEAERFKTVWKIVVATSPIKAPL